MDSKNSSSQCCGVETLHTITAEISKSVCMQKWGKPIKCAVKGVRWKGYIPRLLHAMNEDDHGLRRNTSELLHMGYLEE